jgi:hypothetical protein
VQLVPAPVGALRALSAASNRLDDRRRRSVALHRGCAAAPHNARNNGNDGALPSTQVRCGCMDRTSRSEQSALECRKTTSACLRSHRTVSELLRGKRATVSLAQRVRSIGPPSLGLDRGELRRVKPQESAGNQAAPSQPNEAGGRSRRAAGSDTSAQAPALPACSVRRLRPAGKRGVRSPCGMAPVEAGARLACVR